MALEEGGDLGPWGSSARGVLSAPGETRIS